MIHTVPNPKMTTEDIKNFRREFVKCITKDFTTQQLHEIEKRKARISVTYSKILHNNGGKNPILDY